MVESRFQTNFAFEPHAAAGVGLHVNAQRNTSHQEPIATYKKNTILCGSYKPFYLELVPEEFFCTDEILGHVRSRLGISWFRCHVVFRSFGMVWQDNNKYGGWRSPIRLFVLLCSRNGEITHLDK